MRLKTLAREPCRAELIQRLMTLRPDSVAAWGRMSAHQMICHASDACRMAAGQKPVSPASGLLQRTVVKWTALYLPLPWPAGLETRPEIDQQVSGTKPDDFSVDLAQLAALLEQLATQEPGRAWPMHPIFGRLSHADWLRWAYLHMDHHLRQFGA